MLSQVLSAKSQMTKELVIKELELRIRIKTEQSNFLILYLNDQTSVKLN